MQSGRLTLGLGVGLLTAAVLQVELLLTRLFSVILFYHFAFMAVTIALLGMGGGGLLVYRYRERISRDRFPAWLMGLGIGLTGAILGLLAYALNLRLPFVLHWLNGAKLLATFGLASVPFFFAGAMLSLLIWHFAERVHRIYSYDLIGAALGSITVLPALEWLGAPSAMVFAALLAALGTVLLGAATQAPRPLRSACAVVAVATGLLLGANLQFNLLDIRYTKGAPVADEVFARWNAISRICVHSKQSDLVIRIDCDAATPVSHFDFSKGVSPELLSSFTRYGEDLAHVLRPAAKTLVIGSGGGVDVARALAHGSPRVVAVEINPLIARDLMLGRFRDFSYGLFTRPEVELIVDDARSAVRRSSEQFDVIQATMTDTWAGTAAGAFALSENFLYTTEAFEEYLQHLSPQGVLTVTRWEFSPPRQGIRRGRACPSRAAARWPCRHGPRW